MIAVGMGDETMRYRLAAHGVKQRTDMRRIVGTRINDRNFPPAEDITHRPPEGEWTRVVGHDSPYTRHRLVDHVRRKLEIFVEGNVVVPLSTRPFAGNGRPTL